MPPRRVSDMRYLTLPGSALSVSALCLGTAEFGTSTPAAQAEHLTAAFLEAGGTFFDSAHVYAFWMPGGLGESERTLGRVIRSLGVRNQVVIATKGGHPDAGPDYRRPPDFLSESRVTQDIQESLDRLATDTIDLYYLHRDDGQTPVSEIIEMLNRQIATGAIRYLAASNWSIERIAAANAYASEKGLQRFVASQVQWSLASPKWSIGPDPTTRYVDAVTAEYHKSTGLPVVAYSASAGGYFAGKTEGSYGIPENAARRERARQLAAELGVTPTQIALAWLVNQPFPTVAAFSTGQDAHLAEALGAADIHLSPEQVKWLQVAPFPPAPFPQ